MIHIFRQINKTRKYRELKTLGLYLLISFIVVLNLIMLYNLFNYLIG